MTNVPLISARYAPILPLSAATAARGGQVADSLHLTLDEPTLRHMDALASRWGLSRSALASFLVNRAFLEERLRDPEEAK